MIDKATTTLSPKSKKKRRRTAATIENLHQILIDVKPPVQLVDRQTEMVILTNDSLEILKIPSKENVKKFMAKFLVEMEPQADEVYPNLLIGNYKSVMSLDYLKSKNVTHVLNLGEMDPFGVVPKIDPSSLPGIEYQNYNMTDCDWADKCDEDGQAKAFKDAADIMELILSKGNSTLVVNCLGGLSRSATSVATYLILKKGMTAQRALATLKKGRDVWPSNPNLGFLAKISNQKHGFEKSGNLNACSFCKYF